MPKNNQNKEGFKASVYMKIGYDDLVTYSLHNLKEKGKKPTFENLVVECYTLFPERFQLVGYPQFPDSAQVNRSWLRCRTDKRLIEGTTQKGFRLTLKGLNLVRKVQRKLELSPVERDKLDKKVGDTRSRAGRFVLEIEKSTPYRLYKSTGTLTDVTEFDFCNMLKCTIDTPPSIIKGNMDAFISYCQEYERDDLVYFLKQCKSKFSHFLKEPNEDDYEGGMFKKKA